jgi:hypothetical protein
MLDGFSRRAAAVLATVALVSCSNDPAGPGGSVAELRGAPVSVDVAGRTLSLESHLWRDFMPITPPQGQPLAAVLRIHANTGALPSGLEASAVWVVYGDQVWATEDLEIRPPDAAQSYLEVVARNGPKWGPDVTVDVVVRLVDAEDRRWLLRAADQTILRTD